jgi:hypothetical protein
MVATVDGRGRKAPIGERPHGGEQLFLSGARTVKQDDGRTPVARPHRFQKHPGHALARLGREREVFGPIASRIDTRTGLDRERHPRAVDRLQERRTNPLGLKRLRERRRECQPGQRHTRDTRDAFHQPPFPNP